MSYRYEHGRAILGGSVLVGFIESHDGEHLSISVDGEDTDMLLDIGPEWTVIYDSDCPPSNPVVDDALELLAMKDPARWTTAERALHRAVVSTLPNSKEESREWIEEK